MSIKDFFKKIKSFFRILKDKIWSQEKGLKIKDDLYIVLILILVGTASYGLGKISSYEKNKTPISVIKTENVMYTSVSQSGSVSTSSKGLLVASKSGTKYYYPWCSGVSRITEANKVWFNSIEEAKAAGLTPASNCTGLN
jgi:hypothetical protein